jgi:hypothetical protein
VPDLRGPWPAGLHQKRASPTSSLPPRKIVIFNAGFGKTELRKIVENEGLRHHWLPSLKILNPGLLIVCCYSIIFNFLDCETTTTRDSKLLHQTTRSRNDRKNCKEEAELPRTKFCCIKSYVVQVCCKEFLSFAVYSARSTENFQWRIVLQYSRIHHFLVIADWNEDHENNTDSEHV